MLVAHHINYDFHRLFRRINFGQVSHPKNSNNKMVISKYKSILKYHKHHLPYLVILYLRLYRDTCLDHQSK